jgi:hypothetical protein
MIVHLAEPSEVLESGHAHQLVAIGVTHGRQLLPFHTASGSPASRLQQLHAQVRREWSWVNSFPSVMAAEWRVLVTSFGVVSLLCRSGPL